MSGKFSVFIGSKCDHISLKRSSCKYVTPKVQIILYLFQHILSAHIVLGALYLDILRVLEACVGDI
jgi:hypothetical protein